MEKFTTQDLIAELQEYHKPIPDRREGGVTIKEWSDAQNISEKRAKEELNEFVAQGKLIKEYARLSQHGRGYVYYKA